MKTCPNCKEQSRARKKGACKYCGEFLLIVKGEFRLASDYKLADKILNILSDHISKRDDMQVNLKRDAREKMFAVNLIDRARDFLNAQNFKIKLDKFLTGLIKFVLEVLWWAENIRSLLMLKNHIEKFAQNYFRVERQKIIKIQADKGRINFTGRETLKLDFSAI